MKREILSAEQIADIREKIAHPVLKVKSVSETLFELFDDSNTASSIPVPTGIKCIDDALDGGLYPEMEHFLGAPPSTGKTTLALQIACNIAVSGRNVLFFSLENPEKHNSAKNISRISASLSEIYGTPKNALTFKEIVNSQYRSNLSAVKKSMLKESIEYYSNLGENFKQIYGFGSLTAEDMIEIIISEIAEGNDPPVLIIDFLQYLSGDGYQTTKDIADYATKKLKVIAVMFSIPVLCLSSVARDKYTKDLNADCFKESGGIESGADVAMALQYPPVDQDSAAAATEFYKGQDLRNLQLKIFKDRYGGAANIRQDLTLNAKFNQILEGHHGPVFRSDAVPFDDFGNIAEFKKPAKKNSYSK